jgi:hypothetical protein
MRDLNCKKLFITRTLIVYIPFFTVFTALDFYHQPAAVFCRSDPENRVRKIIAALGDS